MTREIKQTKSLINAHTQKLVDFSEGFFEDLKNKRSDIFEKIETLENEVVSKLDFIEEKTKQIVEKKEGVEVEEKMEEIHDVRDWVNQKIDSVKDSHDWEDVSRKISIDANINVKSPNELQETIFEDKELLSTSVIFFGEFNQIVGYRPDIDYWFSGKTDMDLTESNKQFSYMDGLQASLIFHNKIIFTGTRFLK